MRNPAKLSNRAISVLEHFAQYTSSGGAANAARNKDVARALHISPQAVSNTLRILRQKGYMKDGYEVTPAGEDYLRSRYRVKPVSIPIAGRVQAGRTQSDTLTVYIDSLQDIPWSDAPHIVVPEVREAKRTIALIVRGVSMEDAHIYEGDYVLVELFDDGESPRDGELVVTRYVPMANDIAQHAKNRDFEHIDIDSEGDLEGPTLKYYYPRTNHIRLSPRRDSSEGANVIHAKSIRSIGRVVGVYHKVA